MRLHWAAKLMVGTGTSLRHCMRGFSCRLHAPGLTLLVAAALLLEIYHVVPQRIMDTKIFDTLTAAVPVDCVELWLTMVTTWENDPIINPNPFKARHSRTLHLSHSFCPALTSLIRSGSGQGSS